MGEDKVDEVKETKENSKDPESIKEKIIGKDVNDATNKETTSEALEQADVQDGDRVGDVKNSNVDNKDSESIKKNITVVEEGNETTDEVKTNDSLENADVEVVEGKEEEKK